MVKILTILVKNLTIGKFEKKFTMEMKQENIYQGTPDHMSDGHVCLTDKDCILPNEYTPKAGKHGLIDRPHRPSLS